MGGADAEAPVFPNACAGQRRAAAAGAVQPTGSQILCCTAGEDRWREEKVRKGIVQGSELLVERRAWGSGLHRGEIRRQKPAR